MNSNMVEPESFDHLHRDAQTLSLFYSFLASHFSVYFLVSYVSWEILVLFLSHISHTFFIRVREPVFLQSLSILLLAGVFFSDYIRYAPWENINDLGASTTDSEFFVMVQVEADIYVPKLRLIHD